MKLTSNDFEMTPLSAYGLLLIVCVIGFVGLEKFSDAETNMARRVIAAQTELATLSAIKQTKHWPERLAQSAKEKDVLQSQVWQGQTVGLIAAEVQQNLRELSARLDFDQVKINVYPEAVDIDGIKVLNFNMTGKAPSSKDFADFFEIIATSNKVIIVDEFDFAHSLRDLRPPRLSMSGRVPVLITTLPSDGKGQP